jgi:8-oxo-dGTP diphosphatase
MYLVRHGVAVSRRDWDGDDRDRPLTKRGQRQASALASKLGDRPIGRVLSSPAARCVETVEPLAQGRGLEVERTKALFEGADPAGAIVLVRKAAEEPHDVVLCTHGDLLPEVLRAFRAAGAHVHDGHRWEKGSTWVLDTRHGVVADARYLPPPA